MPVYNVIKYIRSCKAFESGSSCLLPPVGFAFPTLVHRGDRVRWFLGIQTVNVSCKMCVFVHVICALLALCAEAVGLVAVNIYSPLCVSVIREQQWQIVQPRMQMRLLCRKAKYPFL